MQENPWSKSIILTLLASVTIEIGILLYLSWTGEHSMLMPWTFFTLWGGGALAVIAWKASQLNVPPEQFFTLAFAGALVSAVGSLFIPQLLTPRYFGVCSRYSLDTHDTGRGEAYDYPREQGYLYQQYSPELNKDVKNAGKWNEEVQTHGFIHWQTGLAAGFYPDSDSVPDYSDPYGFAEHLEMALTIGPVALLESVLLGVVRHFPVLLLFVAGWYVVTRQHAYWKAARKRRIIESALPHLRLPDAGRRV